MIEIVNTNTLNEALISSKTGAVLKCCASQATSDASKATTTVNTSFRKPILFFYRISFGHLVFYATREPVYLAPR